MEFLTILSAMPTGVYDYIVDIARPKTLKEYAKMSTLNQNYKLMLEDYINSLGCADIFVALGESFGHMTVQEARTYAYLINKLMSRLEVLNYNIYDAKDIGEFLYYAIYEQGKQFTYTDLAGELEKSDKEIYETFVSGISEVDQNSVRQIKETFTKENVQIYDDLWNAWHLVDVIRSDEPIHRVNEFLDEQDALTPSMLIREVAATFKRMPLWRKYMVEV